MTTNVIFLKTTGSVLSWTVPLNWNSNANTIECIGAGGGGARISEEGGGGGGGALPEGRPKGIAGLGIRQWTCSACGAVHDRDVNAALNIARLGHQALAEGALA